MKIQALQMQNPSNYNNNLNKKNTNFTGLYAPKKVLQHLDKFYLFKHGYLDCADNFEVLITKEPLLKGILGKVVSLFTDTPLYIQAGEGIKKNANGELELTGIKTTKHLLGAEPKYSSAFNELKTNILNSITSQNLKKYILKDIFDVREFSPNFLKQTLNSDDYQEAIVHYANKLLEKDSEGNTILHNNKQELLRANSLLADYPNLLANTHMAKNQYGDMPINDIHIMNLVNIDDEVILDTIDKLKSVPQKLLKICKNRGSQGHSLVDILQFHAVTFGDKKIVNMIRDIEKQVKKEKRNK